MITLDYDDWITQYKPEHDDAEDEPRPTDIGYNDPRIVSRPLHIWTYLDIPCECDGPDEDKFWTIEAYDAACDAWNDSHIEDCPSQPMNGQVTIFSGAYYINRMEYYYCEVPFKLNDDIGVN
jgi:hypothetical protein